MGGIIFVVQERYCSGGRTCYKDVFKSVYFDHAVEKIADVACAHPGHTYQLLKRNVFTHQDSLIDVYYISDGGVSN